MLFLQKHLRNKWASRIAGWQNRANKIGIHSDTFIDLDIENILEYWKYKCVYCKQELDEFFEIDHAIPLHKKYSDEYFNLNSIDNLLPCCPCCNRKKGNSTYFDFADDETVNKIEYYFSTLNKM